MIEWIRDGVMPTEVLRELAEKNPEMGRHELSRVFDELVGGLSIEAIQAIWYWRRGPERGECTDDEVNEAVLKSLREAGLL